MGNGLICKPLIEREAAFYAHCAPDLRRFMARCEGAISADRLLNRANNRAGSSPNT